MVDGISKAEAVFVPAIVIGELFYGAHHSDRQAADLARIHGYVAQTTLLGCDVQVAEAYGAIKAAQRRKGRPLPENDLWIAAIAQRHALTLVSRDGHFVEIEGITLERW